ncbi:hypothetical protein FGF66_11620 [Chlorobaculum thiosulfatiphilum]|uniref:SbsA Ig-like domain-containing protein n=1 Tax=Chlorobaculum thiosulfatiphilum TaxID=115852 RepID=A0A5C4S042_CHLTI|nr:Ig-like domain-containing protein [Chlorobaculum thiosulfatiphilum]TNJ36780.1 hypothetical protein FGF66_11620 [Chlorobaculum thiosulfatiphilum]
MTALTPTTIGLYDLANAAWNDIVNLRPRLAFDSATEAIAGNLETLFYDIEEATSDDPIVDNLNATNFTGTFSGELGDMTLSVTGTDINKLFGGGDSIGTVYISNVHFDYSGAGFEFDLQAAGTGIEINFDEVHEDRVTLLDGRFESFSFTTNDLSVTAEGLIDFAYHYSVHDVPVGIGGSYSVEEASAEINGKLTDLTIEYLSAPENYTLSLGGDIHFSMDASGEVSIDGSSFTHFSISESGNYFTYAGDFTYHGDIDTGHVSGSVTEITAAVAGASFVLKGDIEVDDNDVSGYITDLTLHAEGDDLEGNPYDATYSFTGKHVDILDLFEEGDDKIKDINGDGESNEYDLVDFMLNHIDGATLTGVNLPPHAVDDKGTTDSKTTLSVDAAHGLLANDTDWEGDGLTVSEVRFDGKSYTVGEWHVTDDWDETPVSRFIINADGSYEFTPLDDYFSDFHHEDSESGSFDYRVTDTSGNSSLYAKLTITVTGANNAPEVGTTPLESDADEGDAAYQVNLLEDASDSDGDTLSVTDVTYDGSATAPAGLTLDGDTLTVDPSDPAFDSIAEGSSRTITVDYTISDGFGGSVAQTAEVTIDGVNDAPTSEDDLETMTSEGTEKVLAMTDFGTFSDPDTGDTLQTVKITSVAGGELRLYPDMVPLAAMVVGMPAPAYTLVGDDDEITWEQIENGQLRFAPGSGVNTATIGFEVGDGIDFSSESYTLTVKVAESEDVSEGGDTVLGDTTVTLPTGVSGTSETLADDSLTPLEQVIAFVDSEDDLGFMVNREDVYEKAGEYLAEVGEVPVRKLTLEDTGDSDTPIIIDGGETDQVLIIDASDLPPGTVLDLSGVPFAIIIGPGHYEGGEGNNITYAGAGSQFIVLGPGNDYSDGGTGNDVVGSEGGNDTMLGGADNDLVFGGTDDDEVYGGTGSDTVVGGSVVSAASASTPGAITFDDGAGNLLYYVVTDDAGDDSINGGDGDDTVVYVGPHSQYSISYESGVYTVVDTSEGGGTDTVTNVEHFQFADDTFSTDDTVDTTPPELETNNVTGQAISDDIVISFNEMVMSGTGEITLYKGTDLVDTFDVTDPEVSFVGNTLVVNPDGNLEYGTDYYVTFADGSVLDLACNSYEDEHDAFHFTTMNAAVAASGGSSDGISAGAVVAGVAGLGLLAFVIF